MKGFTTEDGFPITEEDNFAHLQDRDIIGGII